MLRRVLLSMSRSGRIRHLVETAPVSRSVVARFVAGTSAEEAVSAVRGLAGRITVGPRSAPRPSQAPEWLRRLPPRPGERA